MPLSEQYPSEAQTAFYMGNSGPFFFGSSDLSDGPDLSTRDDELSQSFTITQPAPVWVATDWTPVDRGHMATKGYVDDLFGGVSGIDLTEFFQKQQHVMKREGAGGPPTDYVFLNPATASPMNRPVVLYHEDPYKGLIHPSLLPSSAVVTPADLTLSPAGVLEFASGSSGVGVLLDPTTIQIIPGTEGYVLKTVSGAVVWDAEATGTVSKARLTLQDQLVFSDGDTFKDDMILDTARTIGIKPSATAADILVTVAGTPKTVGWASFSSIYTEPTHTGDLIAAGLLSGGTLANCLWGSTDYTVGITAAAGNNNKFIATRSGVVQWDGILSTDLPSHTHATTDLSGGTIYQTIAHTGSAWAANSTLRVDDAGGRVGIGVAPGTYKLSVFSTAMSSAAFYGTSDTFYIYDAAHAYNASPVTKLYLGGKYNSGGSSSFFGSIQIEKATTTDGAAGGNLSFWTRKEDNTHQENLKIYGETRQIRFAGDDGIRISFDTTNNYFQFGNLADAARLKIDCDTGSILPSAVDFTGANQPCYFDGTILKGLTGGSEGKIVGITGGVLGWITPDSGITLYDTAPENVTTGTASAGSSGAASKGDHVHKLCTHTHQDNDNGAKLDHGAALTGLTDDDHTQYVLLAGRTSGQTINGGLDASGNLTLSTTANGTKGKYCMPDLGASTGLLKYTTGGSPEGQISIDTSTYLTALPAHVIDSASHTVVNSNTGHVLQITGTNTFGFAALPTHTHSIAHGDLTGVTANQHHNQSHVLTGGDHTVSGLTIGHVLVATAADAFGFAALPTHTHAYVPTTRTITATTPIQIAGTTSADLSADRTISILQASTSQDGYLSQTDWDTFNDKQARLTGATNETLRFSGTNVAANSSALLNDGTTISVAERLKVGGGTGFDTSSTYTGQDALFLADKNTTVGNGVVGTGIGFSLIGNTAGRRAAIAPVQQAVDSDVIGLQVYVHPSGLSADPIVLHTTFHASGALTFGAGAKGTEGQMIYSNANGVPSWGAAPAALVSSVFGRTGAVVATSGDYTTTLVTEGTNLYFTNERVDDRVSALIQNGTGLTWTYDDTANTLTGNVSGFEASFSKGSLIQGANVTLTGSLTGRLYGSGDVTVAATSAPVSSVFGRTGAVVAVSGDYTTTLVTEGTNLYFTNERVDDRVAALLVAGTGINLTYDDAANTLTVVSTASGVGGTGTSGTLTKWTGASTIGDSIVTELGSVLTVTGNAIVTGLTLSRPVVTNASKQLTSALLTLTDVTNTVNVGAAGFLKSTGAAHSFSAVSLATGDTTGTLPLSKFPRFATVGYPLVANGAGLDSSYQVLPTEGGGTGKSINGGTILDGDLLSGTSNGFQRLARSTTAYRVLRGNNTATGTEWGLVELGPTNIAVNGVLRGVNGGTGISTYNIGDLVYASSYTTLAQLSDVATGNALISGGVGAAPSYGKIGLATHVSGMLTVGFGGTGRTTLTSNGVLVGAGTSALTITAAGAADTVLRVPAAGGTPAFGAIDLSKTAAVTGRVVFDNLPLGILTGAPLVSQGLVTSPTYGNLNLDYTTGVLAVTKITAGSDKQILRMSSTTVGWGSIDLASSVAVGTSRLGLANFALGTSGKALVGAGASSSTYTDLSLPNATTGNLQANRVAPGTALQVLRTNADATASEWGTISVTPEWTSDVSPYVEVWTDFTKFQFSANPTTMGSGTQWDYPKIYQTGGWMLFNQDYGGAWSEFLCQCPYVGKGTKLKEIVFVVNWNPSYNEFFKFAIRKMSSNFTSGAGGTFVVSNERDYDVSSRYPGDGGSPAFSQIASTSKYMLTYTFSTAAEFVSGGLRDIVAGVLAAGGDTTDNDPPGISGILWRFTKITYS